MKTLTRLLGSFLIILTATFSANSQNVGIANTTITPDPEAILELRSTTKGVLLPRLTTAQAATLATSLVASDDGMTVYDTNLKRYKYWNGTTLAWDVMATNTSVASSTLDDAYDAGGAGAGSTITADSGPVVISGTGGAGNNALTTDGDVRIGLGSGTNNNLYISNRLVDWDNSTFFVDPGSDSRMNQIEFSNGSIGNPTVWFEGDNNSGLYQPADGIIGVTINGAEAMRINAGRDAGIGTTSPDARLEVQEAAAGSPFPIKVTKESNTTGELIGIGLGAQIGQHYAKSGIVHERESANGTGKLHFLVDDATDGNDVALTEARMTIDRNGLVGVGTQTPLVSMDVRGSMIVGDVFTPSALSDDNKINIMVGVNTLGNENGISFYENANFGMSLGYDGSGSGATNALRVYNNADGHIMTIENGGNVGIGTTTPSTQLHTTGGVRFEGVPSTATNTEVLTRDASGNLAYRAAGSWTGGADNLGNHTATTNLNMGNRQIDNVTFLDMTPGDGNAVRFWSSNSYAIAMGNAGEYHYGPVTNYSIKNHMNNTAGRGWTWGIDGATPIAAINNTGEMQIAKTLTVSGDNTTGGGINISDDGGLYDRNDSYGTMAFSGGVDFEDLQDGGDHMTVLFNNSYPEIWSYVNGGTTLTEFRTGIYNNGGTFYSQNQIYSRGGLANDAGSLLLNDNVQISTLTAGAVVSDAGGNLTVTPYSTFADNLGNHVATTTLTTNGNDIDMVRGDISAIRSLGSLSFDWTAGTYDNAAYHGILSTTENGAFSDDLSINSYDNITNRIDANNNNGTSYFKVEHHSPGNGEDLFWVRSADGYAYHKGNVGIGTTAPGQALDVNGNIHLGSSTGNKQIYTWTATDGNWRIGMSASPGFTRTMNTTHVQYMTYAGGGTQGFAVGVNGGNSSFEVRGSDHAAYFRGRIGVNATPTTVDWQYVYRPGSETGANRSNVYGYRTGTSGATNGGSGYGVSGMDLGLKGYSYWGNNYSAGVGGYCFLDYDRSAGVHGAKYSGSVWGALGYQAVGGGEYGLYYTNFASGTGFAPEGGIRRGIGAGGTGDMLGSWTRGDIMGHISAGEAFASYNLGDEYTSGKQIELVETSNGKKQAYTVTATSSKIYENGEGSISNGTGYVEFSEEIKAMMGAETPTITITPTGMCNGVYLESVTRNGFTVKELANGTANVSFNWIMVSSRIDSKEQTPIVNVLDRSFDQNLLKLMSNENDPNKVGVQMWWDGQKIRFDAPPKEKDAKH